MPVRRADATKDRLGEDEMTATWRRAAFGVAATAAVALAMGACGKARDSGDNNGEKPGGSNANEFVVNPYGFTIQVTGADIPTDPTAASSPPTVTFKVADEKGQPIQNLKDELGKAPNGATPASGYPYTNAPRFTLARLEPDDTYHNVYLNAAGNQAASITLPRDPAQFDARVTSNGNGSYTFKLDPLKENPSADQRKQTWTAGTWASRKASQQSGEEAAATSTLNFVPAGTGSPASRQIVALGACNTCHGPAVRAHGTRLGVQLCLTCHTPQTVDPDTGNSVEFVELVHKIHYGGDRPLAPGEQPYTIVGFQNSVNTYSAAWINDVRNCNLCHQGANADKHFTAASQRACTTCHSIVSFQASSGLPGCSPDRKDTQPCSHPVELAQGTSCTGCHNTQKLESQHVSIFTIAQQFQYEIKGVTVGADRKPVVQFDVLDTATKQPRDLENDPAYKDPASSLNVQLGWPSKEYTNDGTNPTTPAPGQPRSMAIVRAGQLQGTVTKVAGQNGVYQVTSPVALPDGVTSATVFMDGHPVLRNENVPVTSAVNYFGTSGTGDTRRQVVAVENCNKCHGVLSAHGRNRNGTTQVCVVCHNPKATDWQKRQGTDAAGTEQSVDFKVLIHGVHSADIRKDPLTVYGFNGANAARGGAPGTPNEFPGEIPHGVANCVKCHAGTTYEPPLPPEALDTVIDTNNTPLDQSDDKTLGKTQAVCTSCHDQVHFADADKGLPGCSTISPVNSQACFHSGGVQTSDATCASCHGRGGAADVTTVHHVSQ